MKEPKHITFDTKISNNQIFIVFKCGNWVMFVYDVTNKTISNNFRQPKYAGGEMVMVISEVQYVPTTGTAYPLYKELRVQFEKSYKTQRVAYYRGILNKIQSS